MWIMFLDFCFFIKWSHRWLEEPQPSAYQAATLTHLSYYAIKMVGVTGNAPVSKQCQCFVLLLYHTPKMIAVSHIRRTRALESATKLVDEVGNRTHCVFPRKTGRQIPTAHKLVPPVACVTTSFGLKARVIYAFG